MNTYVKTAIALFALICSVTCAYAGDQTERQKEVAQKGAMVMPFNGKNSRHVFTKTWNGGIQQVVALDPTNKDVIAAIQMHLSMEADRFSKGDYTDPMRIHGPDMPGLKYLRSMKPGEMFITYRDLKDGGEIEFASKVPAGADAVHEWFDAQLADHGDDAMPGPGI